MLRSIRSVKWTVAIVTAEISKYHLVFENYMQSLYSIMAVTYSHKVVRTL